MANRSKKISVSFRVGPEFKVKLKALAEKEGISQTELLERIVTDGEYEKYKEWSKEYESFKKELNP